MKKIIIASFIAINILLLSCNTNNSGNKQTDKYEQTKETLAQTEKKNPTRFLIVDGSDKKNLIGQRVVKGTVSSKAKVATYKDVEVEISYFSKTGALLSSTTEVVYDSIPPSGSADFKNKEFAPKGTDSVGLKILSAKVN